MQQQPVQETEQVIGSSMPAEAEGTSQPAVKRNLSTKEKIDKVVDSPQAVKVKDHLINFVDFRLKQFNKPFLLAVLIFAGEFTFTMIIFLSMQTDCATGQISGGSAIDLMQKVNSMRGDISCITSGAARPYACHSDGDRSCEGSRIMYMRSCFFPESDVINGFGFCSADDKEINDLQISARNQWYRDHGSFRCPFSLHRDCVDKFTADRQKEALESQEKWGNIKRDQIPCYNLQAFHPSNDLAGTPWRDSGHTAASWSNEVILYYRNCPYPWNTFGAALGYAGIIQFLLTVIIVSSLWSFGVVDTKDSPMLQWVKGYIMQEKENAKSAAGIAMDSAADAYGI